VALEPYGSLKAFMDEWHKLMKLVAAECGDEMQAYRWRPLSLPDLPAIYNWMPSASFEQRDQSRWRDIPNLLTRIAIGGTDIETRMDRLETYADIFREIVDPVLDQNRPVEGTAYKMWRTGMATVSDRFNELPVLTIQFTFTVWLDRHIHA
jgi:hypothetical protein